MPRFVEGCDRGQSTLFPAVLDEYIGDDNPVRAIDVFVEGLADRGYYEGEEILACETALADTLRRRFRLRHQAGEVLRPRRPPSACR